MHLKEINMVGKPVQQKHGGGRRRDGGDSSNWIIKFKYQIEFHLDSSWRNMGDFAIMKKEVIFSQITWLLVYIECNYSNINTFFFQSEFY